MTIPNPTAPATFLAFNSYNTAGTAATLTTVPATFDFTMNVGLVLERADGIDPTAPGGLLTLNWAERQAHLKKLNADGNSPFSVYGASPQDYGAVKAALTTLGISEVSSPGYVSSQDSRTIWVEVNQSNFAKLLGADIGITTDGAGNNWLSWQGALAFNAALGPAVLGLVFDANETINTSSGSANFSENFAVPVMPSSPPAGSGVVLPQGPQGTGNSSSENSTPFPNEIAALYNFPLTDPTETLKFPTIGLIEPGLGNISPSLTDDLSQLLNEYLAEAVPGLTDPNVVVDGMQPGGILFSPVSSNYAGERALDISVVGAVAPQSKQVLYAGSGNGGIGGTAGNGQSATVTAYQSAIFDTTYKPQIVSSSYGMNAGYPAPGTAFAWTYQQLFVDAALANITMLLANGDGGSGGKYGSGVANNSLASDSPYNLMVGGTSISDSLAASWDSTLSTPWEDALRQDPATLWTLVQGGLTSVPARDDPMQWIVETVWNQYFLTGNEFSETFRGSATPVDTGYFQNLSGAGGLDSSQPTPSYQAAYGLTHAGRGLPDVAANAGGNMFYNVPQADMLTSSITGVGGTSASTPLWASLIAQIDAVFNDQGLPNLGYMNDLLYIADAIAPASFNDVQVGDNNSSFYFGAGAQSYTTVANGTITPTNLGYEAGPGYDYTSGLGSPNGLVLARTLSAIANTQTNNLVNDTSYAVINVDTGGTTLVAQTLLVQNNYSDATVVQVDGTDAVVMGANSTYGWTNQLAGQVVQGDNFDSALVTLFDGGAKSVPYEISVLAGATLGVSAGGQELALYQGLLTNDYGFLQFGDAQGSVTLARPVAVAQLADIPGAPPGQNAILRIRQNGGDDAQLEIYQVDDLNGTVAGYAPGSSQYLAQAAARDYQLVGGGTVIDGPGWGNFLQVEIQGVDQGDYLALKYTNTTTNDIYWAFSQGNAGNATAIYSFGLNTWGFEDRPLTGDHDFQDIVVQIDFTSAAGQGLLVT